VFPYPVRDTERPIPSGGRWYIRPYACTTLAGLLCYGSIAIELHYLFLCNWSYKFYYDYSLSLCAMIVVAVSTAAASVVVVYLTLSSENHKWHWLAFRSGASTSVYVFIYGIWFFFYCGPNMRGVLQTCFYFVHLMLLSLSLGLVCGATAFSSANAFVRRIYRDLKQD